MLCLSRALAVLISRSKCHGKGWSLKIDKHSLFEKKVEDGELNENTLASAMLFNNIEQNPHLNTPYKHFNKCAHR